MREHANSVITGIVISHFHQVPIFSKVIFFEVFEFIFSKKSFKSQKGTVSQLFQQCDEDGVEISVDLRAALETQASSSSAITVPLRQRRTISTRPSFSIAPAFSYDPCGEVLRSSKNLNTTKHKRWSLLFLLTLHETCFCKLSDFSLRHIFLKVHFITIQKYAS